MKKIIFVSFLSMILACSSQIENEYNEIEKSLISNSYMNLWATNPEFSFEVALAKSNKENKEILLLFTGINNSGNPRVMWELLNDEVVYSKIKDKYIFCTLFTDVPYKLHSDEEFSLKEKNMKIQRELIQRESGTNHLLILNENMKIVSDVISVYSLSQKAEIITLLDKKGN